MVARGNLGAGSILIFKLKEETTFTFPRKILFSGCREWIWHEEHTLP